MNIDLRLRLPHPWLVLALTASALAWLAGWQLGMQKVQEIQVLGLEQPIAREDIMAVIETGLAEGMWHFDAELLRASLLTVPWVEDAAIRRHWPNTVVIELQALDPVAQRGNEPILLNSQGKSFYLPRHRIPEALTRIEGTPSDHANMVAILTGIRPMVEAHSIHIATMSQDQRGAITLILANGNILLLGRNSPYQAVERWSLAHTQIEANYQGPVRVDLRYVNGFAVSPRPQQG